MFAYFDTIWSYTDTSKFALIFNATSPKAMAFESILHIKELHM